jgi:phosphatidylserine/phosphatidylglycerophosphate/cardiolipin synthase-like enzyme
MEPESYSGSSSFKYIDQLIEQGNGELIIISPYISNNYAEMVLRAGKHRRVRIITSQSSAEQAKRIMDGSVQKVWTAAKAAVVFIVAASVGLYTGITIISEVAASLAITSSLLAVYWHRSKKKSNINVRIPERFVHEKMYISDELAIVGSANLTYSGTHKNVEHIELIREPDRIDALIAHFNELWDSSG